MQQMNSSSPSLQLAAHLKAVESLSTPFAQRLRSAGALAVNGDPRVQTLNPVMIRIPKSSTTMGTTAAEIQATIQEFSQAFRNVPSEEVRHWLSKELPIVSVSLPAYSLSKYPVTVGNYREFLKDASQMQSLIPSGEPSNFPVSGISIADSKKYCEWLNERTARHFRLPSEAEWEVASNGGIHRRFPWGNEFTRAYANTLELSLGHKTPVGLFVEGYSLHGVADLAGNVEEWVDDLYHPYPGGALVHDDIWEKNGGSYYITRGGSYLHNGDLCRSSRRHGPLSDSVIGFRLAEDL